MFSKKYLRLTKTLMIVLLIFAICFSFMFFNLNTSKNVFALTELENNNCKSCVLIERNSQKILTDKNAKEHLPIASVTKLMTILLTFEHMNCGDINLNDKVLVSENANSMGGSQIFLDANTEYELEDLLKSVIVASANDSSVALAEYISGSERNFVKEMNERAIELGMNDTNYINCTGLPCSGAYSCAYDQAILLGEVLKFDKYTEFAHIWNEDFVHPSGRTTQMTNTNKLSRYYSGCLGGKTGSTNEAKYCLAVGAKKAEMELISVVLGADSTKERFKIASDLLDYGFDNFETRVVFSSNNLTDRFIKIKGLEESTGLYAEESYSIVAPKDKICNCDIIYNLPKMLTSVEAGQIVGNAEIILDGVNTATINILAKDTINEATIWDYVKQITQ